LKSIGVDGSPELLSFFDVSRDFVTLLEVGLESLPELCFSFEVYFAPASSYLGGFSSSAACVRGMPDELILNVVVFPWRVLGPSPLPPDFLYRHVFLIIAFLSAAANGAGLPAVFSLRLESQETPGDPLFRAFLSSLLPRQCCQYWCRIPLGRDRRRGRRKR